MCMSRTQNSHGQVIDTAAIFADTIISNTTLDAGQERKGECKLLQGILDRTEQLSQPAGRAAGSRLRL